MKFKIRNYINNVVDFSRRNGKTTKYAVLALCLICALSVVKQVVDNRAYITDDDGNIVGITRMDAETAHIYSLIVEAKKGGEIIHEKLELFFSGNKDETSENDVQPSARDLLIEAVDKAADMAADSSGSTILLPRMLSDGTVFTWRKNRDYMWLVSLLFIPVVLVLLYENNRTKERMARNLLDNSIRNGLPGFASRLLLISKTGLVLSDAFLLASSDYSVDRENDFEAVIGRMRIKFTEDNQSLASLFEEQAAILKNREFSRLSKAVSDNQKKGVNICEWLEQEGESLWELRKRDAINKGKTMETKLTFPLSALLIVVIIITAAPAVLSMQ